MNRKINLTYHKNKEIIKGFLDVNISDISSVVNYSVDVLYCSVLNKIENSKINNYIDQIIEKIRYGGQLIISITDIHGVCKAYINKSIIDKDFFSIMQNTCENLSEEQIISYIQSKHGLEILGIEKIDYNTIINFQRGLNDKH